MRLLQLQETGNFSLTEFLGHDVPPYAILSHTWGDEEVTYQDLLNGTGRGKEGYAKLTFCAEQAAKDGLTYCWIDTCSIDKSSSAELSEAITSMFRWYRDSAQCYVFLSDVSTHKRKVDYDTSDDPWDSCLRSSRWFTRGWTLQELLAPPMVRFFSREGKELGDKSGLEQLINDVTQIPVSALRGAPLHIFNVTERISWTANRQTTREEDQAYSLLGIFDVSMLPNYGEGKDRAVKRLHKEIEEVAETSKLQGQRKQVIAKIDTWLSAPDTSINYHKALKQRQNDTGVWFLSSEQYAKWKTDKASFLWLYGIPGCGKTILSSTIMEDLLQHRKNNPSHAAVHFYFDFNDKAKQHAEPMLRSVICQLSRQATDVPACVETLFSSHDNGARRPSIDALLPVVRSIVQEIPEVYIMLDALDECTQRAELMEVIDTMKGWQIPSLHMIATSRREHDLEISLQELIDPRNIICLESAIVDKDIEQYIRERLSTDKSLVKWGKDVGLKQEIENALMAKSKGMQVSSRYIEFLAFRANPLDRFRWAACQLDALAKCRNRVMLRNALVALPQTLDETYSRILSAISEEDSDYATRILRWLAFSERPLELGELSEAVAIDIERNPAFNVDEVLEDPQEIFDICPGLITRTTRNDPRPGKLPVEVLSLAHYSVKEYLVSDRITMGSSARYSMREPMSHRFIATACLEYLIHKLQHDLRLSNETFSDLNLASYSSRYWMIHIRKTEGDLDKLHQLAADLLGDTVTYRQWVAMYEDLSWLEAPLYYAARFHLVEVMDLLLSRGADIDGRYDSTNTPLERASHSTSSAIATRLLLDKGANVNGGGGNYGSALAAACDSGNMEVVQLLIERGADVNLRCEDRDGPLVLASAGRHTAVMKLLLKHGANINAEGRVFGTALQIVSKLGNLESAKLLVESGANIDYAGRANASALVIASAEGHFDIARLLVRSGADINANHLASGTAAIA